MTVEDPIEYHLPGIGQMPVNPKVQMTFARGLRAILRQDPDVVMVGEIRDRETADIAVQASLTGHLVLSTLHTNSAVGAVTRLLDMGVDAYLLASSLLGVWRNVWCECCVSTARHPGLLTIKAVERLGLDVGNAMNCSGRRGCEHCQQGYRGRIGIYELITVTPRLAELIHNAASEPELTQRGPNLFPQSVSGRSSTGYGGADQPRRIAACEPGGLGHGMVRLSGSGCLRSPPSSGQEQAQSPRHARQRLARARAVTDRRQTVDQSVHRLGGRAERTLVKMRASWPC